MARRVSGALVLAFLLALGAACLRADTPSPSDIKAAFLFNFTRFVSWPDSPAEAPFLIGIVGTDPFEGQLATILAGRSVGTRRIEVRTVEGAANAGGCQVVFLGLRQNGPLTEILRSVADKPVLTVGDGEAFCRAGGVIAFTLQDDKIKLCVNLEAAARAHLKVSSQLLKIATIVSGAR